MNFSRWKKYSSPAIKFLSRSVDCVEDPDYMGDEVLPNSEFHLMQKVDDQDLVEVEGEASQML